MKIYDSVTLEWDGYRYVTVAESSHDYLGPVDMCCGATGAQNQIQQGQVNFFNQMTQQAASVFGNSSQVFGDLMKTFTPIVAAGPDQEGFSAAEKASLNSQAITNSGIAARNAKQAVGEQVAAQGGGNTGGVTSGSSIATNLSVAQSAAENTADQLNQISQADYATGRQNYQQAVAGMEAAPGVFSTATGTSQAATSAGASASNTANDIAQQNNSWVQGVTGALGGVAGAAVNKIKF